MSCRRKSSRRDSQPCMRSRATRASMRSSCTRTSGARTTLAISSNYMPYWNRAFIVVPRDEKPILLCALSPRVYPWIKTVTVHETIIASPSPPATLFKLCAERGLEASGVCDLDGLPTDLHAELTAGKVELVDIPRSELRPAPASSRSADACARRSDGAQVLEQELRR